AAHRRLRRPHVRDRKRRAAADARPRRRRRDTATHGGIPRVTVAILNIDWQTLADAVGLGGTYALMAVGIGLVFGVLRLVNFAYGQLVMAGAYALAYGSSWGLPVGVSILFCFGVVLAFSVLMDWLVFGSLGTIATSLAPLNQPWDLGGVLIRKISIVSILVAAGCLALLKLLLDRTAVGLHMRAASMDFLTARLLGVRANRVIGGAVLLSGALAAVVAVIMTVRT